MTPEEKANELVEKYSRLGAAIPDFDDCKKCALIAVDEILTGDHLIRTPLSFWKKVKEEITKL
jgi:hypothetical protein